MFTSWILQIVLSELARVPATIESSGPGRQLNFYDPAMSFSYGALGYDFDALQRANNIMRGASCPPSWRQTDNATLYSAAAMSLVQVSVRIDMARDLVTISLKGPAYRWFGVGFERRSGSVRHVLGQGVDPLCEPAAQEFGKEPREGI